MKPRNLDWLPVWAGAIVGLASLVWGADVVGGDSATRPRPPVPQLSAFDAHRGHWLGSEQVEIFVAVEPVFRLLAFRRPGGYSVMAGAAEPHAGVRLAFMEPKQLPTSFDPGDQPGRFLHRDARSARVELDRSPTTQVCYLIDVALAEQSPRLDILVRLRNEAEEDRTFAAWAITSFPRRGSILVPFANEPRGMRRLVYPFWSRLPQPGVVFGFDAMRVDLDASLRGTAYKVGVVSDAGWAAYLGERGGLLSHSPRVEGAIYPEGDANLTIFQNDEEGNAWCEIEHVGPLTRISPGGSAELQVRLFLLPRMDAASDPDRLRQETLDAWQAAGGISER